MRKFKSVWPVSSQSSVRNWFSLCFSTPPHSPEFHVVAGLSPSLPFNILLLAACLREMKPLGAILASSVLFYQSLSLRMHISVSQNWPLRTKNVLNVLQLLGEMFWVFENDSCCLQECSVGGTKLLLCSTVIWRNHWLHYQVLFSDWEHNKTSLDKQLKHVTKKGISFSGPRWVVVFVSNLIFFAGLHFTPHPRTFTTGVSYLDSGLMIWLSSTC